MSRGVSCMVLFMARACHGVASDGRQPAQRDAPVSVAVTGRACLRGRLGSMLLDVRMNRRTVLIPVIAGAVVLAGVGGGVVWQQQRGQSEQDRAARAAADTFARAWSARTLDQPGTSYSGMSAAQVARSFTSVTGGLGTGPVAVKVASVNRSGDTGKAVLDVRWSLPGGRDVGLLRAGAAQAHRQPVERRRGRLPVALAPRSGRQPGADGRPHVGQARRGPRPQRHAAAGRRHGLRRADRPGAGDAGGRDSPGEGRRRAGRVADRQAGGGEEVRLPRPHPRRHLPRGRLRQPARGARADGRGHLPPPRAAARPHPHLRPAAPGVLRSRHRRDGQHAARAATSPATAPASPASRASTTRCSAAPPGSPSRWQAPTRPRRCSSSPRRTARTSPWRSTRRCRRPRRRRSPAARTCRRRWSRST